MVCNSRAFATRFLVQTRHLGATRIAVAVAYREYNLVKVDHSLPCTESTRQPWLYNFPVFLGLVRTFPLVLAFTGVLQYIPAFDPQAITPKEPATATAETESRRGMNGDLATIIQSRSTNARAYKVVIHNDGSATSELSGAGIGLRAEPEPSGFRQFPAGTIDTAKLRRLLEEIGDVSRIPTGGCAKSVSFGRRTQIAYAGQISGDLQCVRQQVSGDDQAPLQASEELGSFVQTTLNQLKIDDRRTSPKQ